DRAGGLAPASELAGARGDGSRAQGTNPLEHAAVVSHPAVGLERRNRHHARGHHRTARGRTSLAAVTFRDPDVDLAGVCHLQLDMAPIAASLDLNPGVEFR